MSLAANAPKIARDKVRTQLALIDGTITDWTVNLFALGAQTRAYVLDQITPDMCPWVFATVAAYSLRSTVSAKKEGFVEIDVYGIVRADSIRFPGKTPDDLNLELLIDVLKTIEASPSLTGADGWLESIDLLEVDLDPENDAWGFTRSRVRYAINGTLGR